MGWRICKADRNDAGRLALVGEATFLETFAGILDGAAIVEHCSRSSSPAALEELLAKGSRAWLAEIDPGGAPIGFALLTKPDLPGAHVDGSDLELKRIYLLSRFHGLGVGAALMNEAVAAARDSGARRLLLGVYSGNERAQAFYRKIGFVPVASRSFRVGSEDYDDTVFALSLE